MRLSIALPIATLLWGMTMGAQATVQSSFDIFQQNAQKSLQSRFSYFTDLKKLTIEAKDNHYPGQPWCGLKGSPYEFNPTKVPPVTFSPAPTDTEKSWLLGLSKVDLSQPTKVKEYVDANLNVISYSHMATSLQSAKDYCATRAKNANQFYQKVLNIGPIEKYISNQTRLDNEFTTIMLESSNDCSAYPAYEAQLTKEAQDLKKDADEFNKKVCPPCFPVQGNKLKERKKALEQKQAIAGTMFQSCMNFTQLFNNTNIPTLFIKP